MINLIKKIYRYILRKILWEIIKRKKITATIIFPDLIPVKKINDDDATKFSWATFWARENSYEYFPLLLINHRANNIKNKIIPNPIINITISTRMLNISNISVINWPAIKSKIKYE